MRLLEGVSPELAGIHVQKCLKDPNVLPPGWRTMMLQPWDAHRPSREDLTRPLFNAPDILQFVAALRANVGKLHQVAGRLPDTAENQRWMLLSAEGHTSYADNYDTRAWGRPGEPLYVLAGYTDLSAAYPGWAGALHQGDLAAQREVIVSHILNVGEALEAIYTLGFEGECSRHQPSRGWMGPLERKVFLQKTLPGLMTDQSKYRAAWEKLEGQWSEFDRHWAKRVAALEKVGAHFESQAFQPGEPIGEAYMQRVLAKVGLLNTSDELLAIFDQRIDWLEEELPNFREEAEESEPLKPISSNADIVKIYERKLAEYKDKMFGGDDPILRLPEGKGFEPKFDWFGKESSGNSTLAALRSDGVIYLRPYEGNEALYAEYRALFEWTVTQEIHHFYQQYRVQGHAKSFHNEFGCETGAKAVEDFLMPDTPLFRYERMKQQLRQAKRAKIILNYTLGKLDDSACLRQLKSIGYSNERAEQILTKAQVTPWTYLQYEVGAISVDMMFEDSPDDMETTFRNYVADTMTVQPPYIAQFDGRNLARLRAATPREVQRVQASRR